MDREALWTMAMFASFPFGYWMVNIDPVWCGLPALALSAGLTARNIMAIWKTRP